MKNSFLWGRFVVISVVCLIANNVCSQTYYFYYQGEKVHMNVNRQYVNVVTSSLFDSNQISSEEVAPFSMLNDNRLREGEFKKLGKLEFIDTIDSDSLYIYKVQILNGTNEVEGVYPYFDYNGKIIGTSNYFAVMLKNSADINLLQNVAAQKNVTIEYQLPYLPLWYVLSTTENTIENTLELAAYFYETSLFEEVEPAFTGALLIEPSQNNTPPPPPQLDICYQEGGIQNLQWNLFDNPLNPLADINICGAWEITKGADPGVKVSKVAIVDTGVQSNLIDLPASSSDVIPTSGSYAGNFYYNNNNQQEHGTLVAGIIGALHNGQLAGGIAPDAVMLYVANELAGPPFSQIQIANGISTAVNNHLVDVVNMSFSNYSIPSSILASALNNALINGRFGYGAVLVAATGNDNNSTIQQPANFPGVIAVGGSQVEGYYNGYNFGAEIDLVAPSTSIPTTRFGNLTVNNFNGTSSAAPHVSGVAALMISTNEFIKGLAVRNIMRRTAQRGSDPLYGDLLTTYGRTGPWNMHLGSGIIDATACVLTAVEFETGTDILDLHMRNSLNDFGHEPDNVTETSNFELWNSPDIWVRNGFEYSYVHENPEYGSPNGTYVYVRVINKSNTPVIANNARVKLYWSKVGGNTNNWPGNWDGTETRINCWNQTVPLGGVIPGLNGGIEGEIIDPILPGEEDILIFQWNVPNPGQYGCIFEDANPNDFGFVATIVTNNDPISSNTSDIWVNTKNDNNIVWKNVQVVSPPTPTIGNILIGNDTNSTNEYSLEFSICDNEIGEPIFKEAEVAVLLDNEMYQDWQSSGSVKSNFDVANQRFVVSENDAKIENISLLSGEYRPIQVSFNFLTDELTEKKEFDYHFVQKEKSTGKIISGKTFHINKGEMNPFDADAGEDKEIDKNDSVTLYAEAINEPATYNWYDFQGNLIYTGMDLTVSPDITQQYQLEVIKDFDGLKDYDQVEVEVNPFVLGIISPNPTSNFVTVNYMAEDAASAYIILTELNTNNTYNYILNTNEPSITIDVSSYSTGIFFVTLVCDGNIIEDASLIID